MKKAYYLFLIILFAACTNSDNNGNPGSNDGKTGDNTSTPQVKQIGYSVVESFPHDTSFFTEGLLIYNGDMYESTGLEDKSRLMKIDLKTGRVLQNLNLDKKYFGEGIVIINDTIYQLTYQNKVGFMYSLKDFKKLGEFTFASPEGWGMTTDGKQIIATDGTSNLSYYEPGTFRLLRTQSITEGGSLSYNLNELEYIDGYIYANQWQAPYILKIDPNSGNIVGKIDLTELCNQVKAKDPHSEFMNGIAYDAQTKKIYITGKLWPELFEVQFSQ